jgi:hypothetical protein
MPTKRQDGDSCLDLVRKRLEREDLTPLEEARLYGVFLTQINPATGKHWTIKEVAQYVGKPYAQVRNRWALVTPFQPDVVDEHGNVVRKGLGLTNEERAALERGEKSVAEMTRRALREEKAGKSIPLRAMERLFDETAADNLERRRAIAECMGLALSQAIAESSERTND